VVRRPPFDELQIETDGQYWIEVGRLQPARFFLFRENSREFAAETTSSQLFSQLHSFDV